MEDITNNAQEGHQVVEIEQMHVEDMAIYPRNLCHIATEEDRWEMCFPRKIYEGGGSPIFHYAGWWWSWVNAISIYPMAYAIDFMMSRCIFTENGMMYVGPVFRLYIYAQLFSMFVLQFKFRGVRDRLVGRHGKFMTDVIATCATLMLRHCVPFDFGESSITALVFLISFTMQIHSWAQVLHLAGDISLKDMLVEIFMEVLIYISGTTLCFFLIFSFCGLICFKYFCYSVANTIEVTKKDLESLPC